MTIAEAENILEPIKDNEKALKEILKYINKRIDKVNGNRRTLNKPRF